MPEPQPLSDEAAHDRLVAARDALGDAPGASTRADAALAAARKTLALLQLALVAAMERTRQDD